VKKVGRQDLTPLDYAMPQPRVFVSRPLFPDTLELLRAHVDIDVFEHGGGPSRDELIARAQGCGGLITQGTDQVDAALLDALPDLRIVANVAVGYNNIDVAAAAARHVVVTNTPDVLNEACAGLTWGLILGITRRLGEGERILRAGRWEGFALDFLLGMELVDRQIGIIGMGRIGQNVAAKALAFGMRVAFLRSPRRPEERLTGPDGTVYTGMDLDQLLATSDVVTLHVPLTAETRHLMNRRTLAQMKPTAYLVNMARGPVVEEAALVEALDQGWIAGAALDVYELEPAVHPGLLAFENVLLAPHLGSATVEARTGMATLAARNVIAVVDGRAPLTPVPGSHLPVSTT
jgi:glyoxylate reductase